MASTDPTTTVIIATLNTDVDAFLGNTVSEYHMTDEQIAAAERDYIETMREAIEARYPNASVDVDGGAYRTRIGAYRDRITLERSDMPLDGEDITELFGHVWSDWLKSDSLGAILGDNEAPVLAAEADRHPRDIDGTSVDPETGDPSVLVRCPDCGQMEWWTYREARIDHGQCRALPADTYCDACH